MNKKTSQKFEHATDIKFSLEKHSCQEVFYISIQSKSIGHGILQAYKKNSAILSDFEIMPRSQGLGYGKMLLNYILIHSQYENIYLATIIPNFYLQYGFQLLKHYPDFVDHEHPDCKACNIDKCQAMIYQKFSHS